MFELAKQHNRRIDIHCDETDDPSSRFLEVMADDTVKFGLGGRVTASHCTAMGSYEPYYSSKLHGFLRRAGINIVVNPYANSLIQGRLDVYPKRRGFAQLASRRHGELVRAPPLRRRHGRECFADLLAVPLGVDGRLPRAVTAPLAVALEAVALTHSGSHQEPRPGDAAVYGADCMGADPPVPCPRPRQRCGGAL